MAILYNTKPLTALQAAHLLRRATFGFTKAQIAEYTNIKPDVAVGKLLAAQPAPTPPIDAATGLPFFDQPYDQTTNAALVTNIKAWLIGQMVSNAPSLQEKMTLFLQNIFVVNTSTVNDHHYIYKYITLIQQHALGNYKTLATQITKDPAMLRFLNGNVNTNLNANENYGREFQELFTIGRIKPDGTTNYTEDDVKAAARVLTGWDDTGYRSTTPGGAISTVFVSTKHDTADKKFSSKYGSKIITGRTGATAGDVELTDLVEMIFSKTETSKNICRKLYRWFVQSDISTTNENGIIADLATILRNNNFDLKPVLTALFRSQHFYDTTQVGSIIKSPLELTVGLLRYFELKPTSMTTNAADFYSFTKYLNSRCIEQQQEVIDQTTVFGWPAYNNTGYYQIWINSNTLGYRNKFTDDFIRGNFRVNGVKITIDSVELAKKVSVPSDSVALINELSANLFAVAITQTQKDYLIDSVLIPGLPRIEWTIEWNDYINTPVTDPKYSNKYKAVKGKLDDLFIYMLRMAEYQMN